MVIKTPERELADLRAKELAERELADLRAKKLAVHDAMHALPDEELDLKAFFAPPNLGPPAKLAPVLRAVSEVATRTPGPITLYADHYRMLDQLAGPDAEFYWGPVRLVAERPIDPSIIC